SPAIQPDGSVFIPAGSSDSDGDGLPDAWEEAFFPGDLTRLASGEDFDGDGLNDEDEESAGTDPTDGDSDDDGLTDGAEIDLGTDPR
ncbi:MAG: hypothetical protein GWO24_01845, partial [Akkermansiaceae bacterium]|nr:hypothetical protein [Akkermansiaceae bacterium]